MTFDPTPLNGRPSGKSATGLRAGIRKYSEALELMWMQYVVSYDRQGQRTLARSLRDRLNGYRSGIDSSISDLQLRFSSWWNDGAASDATVTQARALLVPGVILLVAVLIFTLWKRRLDRSRSSKSVLNERASTPVVVFYRRMIEALEARGLKRAPWQTPQEFALQVGTPEAVIITDAYHRVRYGAEDLSAGETAEMERCLRRMEKEQGETDQLPV